MLFKLRLDCFRPVDGKLNLHSQVVPGEKVSTHHRMQTRLESKFSTLYINIHSGRFFVQVPHRNARSALSRESSLLWKSHKEEGKTFFADLGKHKIFAMPFGVTKKVCGDIQQIWIGKFFRSVHPLSWKFYDVISNSNIELCDVTTWIYVPSWSCRRRMCEKLTTEPQRSYPNDLAKCFTPFSIYASRYAFLIIMSSNGSHCLLRGELYNPITWRLQKVSHQTFSTKWNLFLCRRKHIVHEQNLCGNSIIPSLEPPQAGAQLFLMMF